MEYDDTEISVLNKTNASKEVYTDEESLDIIILLGTTYTLIFVAGVLGNISTCVVIGRIRLMHTATNFYLFSLAISDFLLLICGLPLEIYKLFKPLTYPLNEALCITLGLISETSANATVLTITAFTVERYIAICHPFMSHTMSKLSRAVRYIIGVWICALCTAVPQAMQFGIVVYNDTAQVINACTVKGHGVHQVFVISSFVFFVVPMSIITVLYILIGIKLRTSCVLHPVKKSSVENSEKPNGVANNKMSTRYRNGVSQRRVIRMLVAVALSFFICWAPFHVQRLLAIYGKTLEHPTELFLQVYIILTYLSGVFYYLSTAINPILYNIMSNKFRNAFKMTLSMCCKRKGSRNLDRTYSAMMASKHQRAARADHQCRNRHRRVPSCHLPTEVTQLCDAPQGNNHRNVFSEKKSRANWPSKCRPNESDSLTSPRSISNSSLHEVDQELSGEELTTFLYQVNCNLNGRT